MYTYTEEVVEGEIHAYHDKVDYVQKVSVTGNTVVTGSYEYQVCDESMCLPPKTKKFKIEIKDATEAVDTTAVASTSPDTLMPESMAAALADDTTQGKSAMTADDASEKKQEQKSLLWLFLAAFLGGLLAVLTPCVYSMIPITVSFFTKRSKTRKEGIRNAIYYSLSIIIIFTVLGVLISIFFGGNALNNLSTNWIANLFFFAIFMVFGISFLGAFEITLPSSWTNKTDSRANTKSFMGYSLWR